MPGCVLRAAGADFDVDKFVGVSTLSSCEVYRKGEPKGRRGKLHEKSGLNIIVSEADGDDLQQQIEDAVKFLEENMAEVEFLFRFAEDVSLDFGVWQRASSVITATSRLHCYVSLAAWGWVLSCQYMSEKIVELFRRKTPSSGM